ncbi:MAG: hypothetical protein QOG00_1370 [Pyrinomonadaceae bacterium]|jgi:hypothetical protein|nr:hypothetical protein [Pyrinomonadaceae bacterium]MDQ1611439.1 hypothetical protein [Pyrinomonadaceae bacterium]
MSEQINSGQTEESAETHASGLLLSVEPLQASAQLNASDDNADAGGSGVKDTSDDAGGDTDSSDAGGADTDLTDTLGADTDGSDAADADGSDSDDSGPTITIDSAAADTHGSKFVTAEADSALEIDNKDAA